MSERIKVLNVDASEQDLPAGRFSTWLDLTEHAQTAGADVPCGTCNACCKSSYFIHIENSETESLAHIPKALLFDAPGMPGHRVMGYNEQGQCPMLINDQCSIYEHRPKTCRVYDCRVFPAAGIQPESDKALVGHQVRRWKFDTSSEQDGELFDATQAAARFLLSRGSEFVEGLIPNNATQLAVLATKLRKLFVAGTTQPSEQEVADAIRETRR